jgi:hypothetical protein
MTAAARQAAIALVPANIIAAIDDDRWWRPWFRRGDWSAWRAFLAAAFALPMDADQLAIFQECTGRTEPPSKQAEEAWAICGRRGGKTRIMSTVAAWIAAFCDWRQYLAPGEMATVMLIAANRKQARTSMRYLRSLFLEHPMLSQLVVRETDDTLELSNSVITEITTASFRTSRGYSVAAVICDELAFWMADEDSANPADEIIESLRPAMATLPGALLMVATSPYSRRGPVYQTWKTHYGKTDDPILVWKAPTRRMNPAMPQAIIDRALERDPASASAEYMAEFRSDIESYIAAEVVEAAIVPDRHELPPGGFSYAAFVDPSGGSADSMTMAIGHKEYEAKIGVIDAIREVRPPFSPESVVEEFAQLLHRYGITEITGDRYAGEWPREAFRNHGIDYTPSEHSKSDLYRDLLPILNSRQAELPDHPRLQSQLVTLERRTARGGRDSIDHPPGAHDDVANAVAGVLVRLMGEFSGAANFLAIGRKFVGIVPGMGSYAETPGPPPAAGFSNTPDETRDGVAAAPNTVDQRRIQLRQRMPGISTVIRPNEPLMAMLVPKDVILTTENAEGRNIAVLIPAGVAQIPTRLADHWWLRAQGVRYADEPVDAAL